MGSRDQRTGHMGSPGLLQLYSNSAPGVRAVTVKSMTMPLSPKSSFAAPPGLSSIEPGASHCGSHSGAVSAAHTRST